MDFFFFFFFDNIDKKTYRFCILLWKHVSMKKLLLFLFLLSSFTCMGNGMRQSINIIDTFHTSSSIKQLVRLLCLLWNGLAHTRARTRVCVLTRSAKSGHLSMFYPCEVQTFEQERTHWRSAIGFTLRFGLVILENLGVDHKIMGVVWVRSWHWNYFWNHFT